VSPLVEPPPDVRSQPLSGAARVQYRVRLVDRAADLPAADWAKVQAVAPTVFMDPRFLTTVERAFASQGRFHYAIVVDQHERPVAWTSLCTFPVDVLTLAGPRLQALAGGARAVLPGLGFLRTLFVGLPVSLGQSHLAIAPDAEPAAVVAALDEALAAIAARERVWLVVWKEFDPAGAARLAPLLERGYRRAESPAMHELDRRFKDFADYCAALTSHYRYDVRRSERKFRASGFRVAQLHDADEIRRVYTAEVHRLYEAVVAKSSVKLEVLPIEFFHELVRQLPGLVTLTTIAAGDRIVAFNWGLMDGRVHHYLFCGLDYTVAHDADLYFNLMYHQLDDALRRNPERIEVGQTADTFKARLGCRPTPRYFFVKPRGLVAGPALRHGFELLFPPRPATQVHSVFRS
jgi:predicted N-acyltransferase